MNIIVAITGASGAIYARQALEILSSHANIERIALVLSDNAERVIEAEGVELPLSERITRYANDDMWSSVASGSARWDAMLIIPSSMGTVGRIASGISRTLIERAADVMLKERRRLVLVVRESPYSLIHLRNMTTLTEAGAIIVPASPSFYFRPQSIEELCLGTTQRALEMCGVEVSHRAWGEEAAIIDKESESGTTPPANEIWYNNGSTTIATKPNHNAFDAEIVSNLYDNDKQYWVIKCDRNITEIKTNAFHQTNITDIKIPDSVITIGESAFNFCKRLTNITLGKQVNCIGEYAFSCCYRLSEITIPDSMESIGNYAFDGCIKLKRFRGKFATADGKCLIINSILHSFARADVKSYTIPDGVTVIGRGVFNTCHLSHITIPNSVTTIESSAFSGCGIINITIPNSVTTIGKSAFNSCNSLTSIDIPNSVISIGESALSCPRLKSITLPNNITEIKEYTFALCTHLTSISIPDNVTTIRGSAFINCRELISIEIGKKIKVIEHGIFENCNKLKSFYIKAEIPPIIDNFIFTKYEYHFRKPIGCNIYVPYKSVEQYKTAQNWNRYTNYIIGYDFEKNETVE